MSEVARKIFIGRASIVQWGPLMPLIAGCRVVVGVLPYNRSVNSCKNLQQSNPQRQYVTRDTWPWQGLALRGSLTLLSRLQTMVFNDIRLLSENSHYLLYASLLHSCIVTINAMCKPLRGRSLDNRKGRGSSIRIKPRSEDNTTRSAKLQT